MLDNLEKSSSIRALKTSEDKRIIIESLSQASKAVLISLLKNWYQKDILIISGGSREDDLISNLQENALEFYALDNLFSEDLSISKDIIGKRYEVLNDLHNKSSSKIVLTSLLGALQHVPNKDAIAASFHIFKKNNHFDFDNLSSFFNNLGYKKQPIVTDKGEFAIRGGIVDIFSPLAEAPYRIEFSGNEIDNIRIFDPVGQKTIEKIDKAIICPTEEKESSLFLLNYLDKDCLIVFDDLLAIENNYVTLKKAFSSNKLKSFDTFLSEIKSHSQYLFTKDSIENISAKTKKEKKSSYFEKISFDIFNKNIEGSKWLHPFDEMADYLFTKTNQEDLTVAEQIDLLTTTNTNIIFLSQTKEEEDQIKKLLQEINLPSNKLIAFEKYYLSSGFVIRDIPLAFFPFSQIFNQKKIRRQKWRNTYHTPAAEFHKLSIGDLVVHYHSGIGKYLGVEKLKNNEGNLTEFLIVEYSNNSKLYVPISQAHLISRYIGTHDELSSLNSLGSNKWQQTKQLAQKQIIGYASELLHIYAERVIEEGFSFPQDSIDLKIFEEDFPYIPTDDQEKSIQSIKYDMISKKPMDRLICGDVGYGKTEVAMRAAFKAAIDGNKQVAVLVPTTVLALQHFDTFSERMANYPIKIAVLSRFNKAVQNKKIIEQVKKQEIDILIGTHRLISKDVSFKNLGLIIIDEEQRFGVRAKEKLKEFKKTVDCITLSATPIPRTLYMSMINIKDISIISSPPQDRLPIKTIIATNEDTVIKNAILKELSREGQIFFIHNRVESITQRASYIQKLLPNLKIGIVHGQLDPKDVDKIFHQFKIGDLDLLIATTIIENGIDVPNANTILIDKADTYGLADLYQLRGRVGRWNKAANCYFLIDKNRKPTPIAKKRLQALVEASGYGGGMKIALKDLEIRGAGDILGVRQSGQIANIGFHLYCKLLKKTIDAIRNKKQVSFIETKLEFSFNATLPEDYINESSIRMEIYNRLGEASSKEEVDNILIELKDRFGSPPLSVIFLINLTKIRIFANNNNFTLIKFNKVSITAEKQIKKKIISKSKLMQRSINTPEKIKDFTIDFLKSF